MTTQILVAVATVLTIAVNIAATALPINGVTTAELSDEFSVFFIPAGYVFSIWGLIYLGLIAYMVYQFLPAQRKSPMLMKIAPWYLISSGANIAWILFWHHRQVEYSLACMLVLLVSLIQIYNILKIGKVKSTMTRNWTVNIPFSLYLGWISVATVANVTVALDVANWDGLGLAPQVWAAIMIGVAVFLSVVALWTRKDIVYALVIIWATTGIYAKFPQVNEIGAVVLVGVLVQLVFIAIAIYRTWLHGDHK